MGNIHGEADKDCSAWSEEKRLYGHSYSRRSGDTRFESRHPRHKQKRIDRAVCQGTDEGLATRRSSATGGILRQLIARCRIRLAKLEEQVKEQVDEIYLLESALKRVESISDKT